MSFDFEMKTNLTFSVRCTIRYMDHCYIRAVTRIWLNTLVWVCLMSEVKYLDGYSWGTQKLLRVRFKHM